ncbi:MAG: DUF4405 domain-containing protein [Desulfobacterales bacterium]|jgi:hypothetical protein
MKIRRITSLTALLSFSLLILTAIILYIVPQGRIAYWADWRLWGLTKTQWGNIHIILGVLLLISISFHVYYNWKPIVSYLKNKAKQLKVFTPEFNAALAITAVFIMGAYIYLPPFSWIIDWSTSIKDAAAVRYGEPPYGHAELSTLKTFAGKVNLDLAESVGNLRSAGISLADENQTLLEIAKINHLSPQQVYSAMKPKEGSSRLDKLLPDSPTPGMGRRTIADICNAYNLNIPVIMRGLAKENIKASADMSLKKIAEENNLSPVEVYEVIKRLSAG